jgi:lipid-binding SYLF domain-containing protein
MKKLILYTFLFLISSTILFSQWKTRSVSNEVMDEVLFTVEDFKEISELTMYFDQAYGFAVFPSIKKAGFGIGGARGKGQVFVDEQLIGDSTVTQINLGINLGVQSYQEIIFFRNKVDLDRFISGNFELGAQASAVAIKAGIATEVEYSNGVAIFTKAIGGLMLEASIGGQKFSFNPVIKN